MLASILESLKRYPYYTGFIGFLLSFLVFRNVKSRRRNPSALPRPPGPKGYPLIGSLFSFPINDSWLVYDKWQKVYGDMVYFEVLGRSFLILGSLHRTTEVFDKRSSVSSDRPHLIMLGELMGLEHFPLLSYGAFWRRHRRVVHQFFQRGAVSSYEPIQTRETINLISRLLETPDEFEGHIRHIFQATAMDTMYGIKVKKAGDPYLQRVNALMEGMTEASFPGRFLVDLMPVLKYVPSWVPGAGFKRFAARISLLNKQVLNLPFEEVERRLKDGEVDDPPEPAAAVLLQQLPEGDILRREEDRKVAQNVLATAALAGTDTVFGVIHTFILAIAMYPDVQRRAQSEIDRVVGSKRLPDFRDRESLPYVDAILKESLRWAPVAPLALPHSLSEDMEYGGYFLPKGTILVGNAWSIMHDAEEYPNPEKFYPERFLKDGQLNPQVRQPDSAFGFGRRVCPGKDFAMNSFYSIASSILAVYHIAPATDLQGQPIKLEAKFLPGPLGSPVPFRCSFKPRSDAARSLIIDLTEMQK